MSNCAEKALKTLNREVLMSAKQLMNAAAAALKILKTQKQALSMSMQIQLIPLKLKKAVLDGVVGGVRESVRIIPASVTALCPDLGSINVMLEKSVVGPLEGSINALDTINRTVSISAELDAEIAEIDGAIAFFEDMSTSIDNVLKDS
jgi:hypothetical protein